MDVFDLQARIGIDTSEYERGMQQASNISSQTSRNIRQQVSQLAAQYRSDGMNASDAFTRAWSEIDRTQSQTAENSQTNSKHFFTNWKDAFSNVTSIAKSIFSGTLNIAESVGKGLINIADTAISVAKNVGSATTGFLKSAVATGQSFDSAMSQVAATLGTSVDQVQDLRDFAKEMGATTKFTATESAEALNYMALAGYNAEQSMQMLPTVLNLASAGGMALAQASDVVTDAQTAFGMSFERTTLMVDEMAKAASTGNTSVSQLGEAFLTVGALARELNGGFVTLADGTQVETDGIQELETALVAMANAGIKGSEAGTHMRNMILKLSSPTDKGAKQFEKLGVQVFDTAGKMKPLSQIFSDLKVGLDSLTQSEKLQAISELFNARDTASAEAILAAIGEDWNKIGAAIQEADGAAAAMSSTQINNLSGAVTILNSGLDALKISISDKVTPALTNFVKIGTAGVSVLTKEIEKADLSGFNKTIYELEQSAKAFETGGLDNFIARFGLALPDIMDNLSEELSKMPEKIGNTINRFFDEISRGFSLANPEKIQKSASNLFKVILDGIVKGIPKKMSMISKAFSSIVDFIVINGDEFIDVGLQILDSITTGIVENAPKIAESASKLLVFLSGAISDNMPQLVQMGSDIISSLVNGFFAIDWGTIAVNLFDAISTIIGDASQLLEKINWEQLGETISEFLNGIDWQTILGSVFNLIGTLIKNAPELLAGVVENLDVTGQAVLIGGLFGRRFITHILTTVSGAGLVPTFTGIAEFLTTTLTAPAFGIGSSFGTTMIAALSSALLGWHIGTWIRENWFDEEELDNTVEACMDFWKEVGENLKGLFSSSGQGYGDTYADYYNDDGTPIPRFAKGGVITKPTLAIVGEQGAEAIVPLANNTQWVDNVASRMGAVNNSNSGMVIENVNISMQGMSISSDYDTDRFIERISERLELLKRSQLSGIGGVVV